jgi:hypothetical protein
LRFSVLAVKKLKIWLRFTRKKQQQCCLISAFDFDSFSLFLTDSACVMYSSKTRGNHGWGFIFSADFPLFLRVGE